MSDSQQTTPLAGTLDRVASCVDQIIYIIDGLKGHKYPNTLVRPSIGMMKGLMKSALDSIKGFTAEEIALLGASAAHTAAPSPASAASAAAIKANAQPADSPKGGEDDFTL